MSDALWSEAELTEALGAPPGAPLRAPIEGVSIDTPRFARAICFSPSRARWATAMIMSGAPSRRGREPAW